jgi:protein O-GlcNAc transferase
MGKGKAPRHFSQPVLRAASGTVMGSTEFQQARAHHQKGELAQAERLYKTVLAHQPQHFDALHLLGLLALQCDQALTGLELIGKALQINPTSCAAHLNMGNALRSLRRFNDALASYDRAIAIKPDYAEALNNRGVTLEDLGRLPDALASFEQALHLKPDYVDALSNRGNACRAMKRSAEALTSYEQALTLNPGHVQSWHNRGVALQDLMRHDEALASYDRALEIQPAYAEALNNRADVLQALKRPEEACTGYERLLQTSPSFPYAAGKLLHSQLHSCVWHQHAQSIEHITQAVNRGELVDTPSYFLAVSASPAAQLKCARTYIAAKHPDSHQPLWAGEHYAHERIRVAYLSADFHSHATSYLMAELFETHDKSRFDVVAISFGPNARSSMRERLERSFTQFIDVRDKSDLDIARMLRSLEIDIAVDLKGFTQGSRTGIFAHRAAPLQVNYLGYPGTLGADYMDYIIADAHVIPPGYEAFYAEKVVRLPDSYQVNDSKRAIAPDTPSRAAVGLPDTGFVFCSFNNNYKITPDIFDIWMRLLQKVEGSVLWLLEDNPAASRNLQKEAELRGISRTRLVFAPRMALDAHLARHRLADLFLDTLPINAHTTASDALWAGLPVLTCMGEAFASRVAASLLHAVGLSELVTHHLKDYESLALTLALTPGLLADIKAKLERNRATFPLFNTNRYRQHIEGAYATMHARHQQGLQPASFAIQAVTQGPL